MDPTALATMTAQQWISVTILLVLVACAGYTVARLSGQRAERIRREAPLTLRRNPWKEFDGDE